VRFNMGLDVAVWGAIGLVLLIIAVATG
jgi:hypothetical protein